MNSSGVDVVDEQLEEQQHAEDEPVAARHRHALLRRLPLGQLTTQGVQVPEGGRQEIRALLLPYITTISVFNGNTLVPHSFQLIYTHECIHIRYTFV